jgi:molybdenum cofactor cytidylyltransferase
VHEDEAAARVAAAVSGPNLSASAAFTGRVNLFAESAGLCVLDPERIDRLNLIDEAITIATLPAFAPVEPKQIVATIKTIPFAAPAAAVEACERIARENGPPIRVATYAPRRAGLIQTRLPGMKESILDKTVEVMRERLLGLGSALIDETRCAHDDEAVAAAIHKLRALGCDLILIAGASAITDRRDVLPSGIERAGGVVEHFGMPVDPGQLILLAHLENKPVLGLPGCARSPKLNGFDWVLQRLATGTPVTGRDIMRMGVGGLLTEIPSRPLPRAQATAEPGSGVPRAPRVAAIVLAGGQSRRMGAANKLTADVGGSPMVVHAVDAVLASQARPVIVVTGHEHEKVEATLADRAVTFVHNPDYAEGLSTSMKAGLAALPAGIDAALVCLGDMPRITPGTIDRLIAAYNPVEGRAICVPTVRGKRGNPVLFDHRFFPEMRDVEGDVGARHLIGAHGDQLCEVEMTDDGALIDVDTPEALRSLTAASPNG